MSNTDFEVHLENFSGPFEVLLSLISKHQMDITEVSLAKVTDEFIAYIRAAEQNLEAGGWDLGEVSEFLVIAATLLDLKAARLLPSAEVEDAEDIARLEARDLLFARLLQYRAYKEVASSFAERLSAGARRFPRVVALEEQFAKLLPELVWQLSPTDFAQLAAHALKPKMPPTVDLSHLHGARVSVREQATIITDRLRAAGTLSFRDLTADADSTGVVVGRFLALLELFREGAVSFTQVVSLGELTVQWTGSAEGVVEVHDDYDDDAPTDFISEQDLIPRESSGD